MAMKHRTLGKPGLDVPIQGLGCMGMTFGYGDADATEAVATIHRALELGVTLLDTADMYGPHTNEEPHPARKTANSTEAANATWLAEPSIPDFGRSSVSAGAKTNAKMKESMPSSVQPSHAAQNPRTCAGVSRSTLGRMRPPPFGIGAL